MSDWFDSAWAWLQTGGPTSGVWFNFDEGEFTGIDTENVGMAAAVTNTAEDAAEGIKDVLTPPWYATLGGAAVLVLVGWFALKRL